MYNYETRVTLISNDLLYLKYSQNRLSLAFFFSIIRVIPEGWGAFQLSEFTSDVGRLFENYRLASLAIREMLSKLLGVLIFVLRPRHIRLVSHFLYQLQHGENLGPSVPLPFVSCGGLRILIPEVFWVIVNLNGSDEKLAPPVSNLGSEMAAGEYNIMAKGKGNRVVSYITRDGDRNLPSNCTSCL
jgi:hypothetical protein